MEEEECVTADKTLKSNYRSARIGLDLLLTVNPCTSVLPPCTTLYIRSFILLSPEKHPIYAAKPLQTHERG